MASFSLIAVLLGALALGASGQSAATAGRMSPITKVVKLLEEMKSSVEDEAEADKETFEKFDCWCTTNEAEKTKAVKDAGQLIDQLSSDIEDYTANIARLTTEIETLEGEIAKNTEALQTATAMREKENAEYEVETKDMRDALESLNGAIKTLEKVQLVQKTSPEDAGVMLLQVKNTVAHIHKRFNKFGAEMQKDLWALMGSTRLLDQVGADSENAKKAALSTAQVLGEMFELKMDGASSSSLRGSSAALEQQDPESPTRKGGGGVAGAKSYNSRSGAIFGILTAMKDEFDKNLKGAISEEEEAAKSFAEMKAAKEAEIAAANKGVDEKTAELADTQDKNAQAKEDLEATEKQMAADQEFLVDMKEKCEVATQEYSVRVTTRSEEIRGIGETIKILTEDDARSTFGKTQGEIGFIQVDSRTSAHMETRLRSQAAAAIVEIARENKDWSLATLAVSINLDAFDKVKKAMDDMIAELKTQQEDEYKKKNGCEDDLDENEDSIKEKGYDKKDQESKIQDLEGTVETLTNEIEALKSQISEAQVQLKRSGEDRAAQNKEFQQVVKDQRATVAILRKAEARLKMFYAPKEEAAPAALVEVREHRQAPPPSGKPMSDKSGAAGGVLGMIQMIIEEAQRNEEEAIADEQTAQTTYASFVGETNKSLDLANKDLNEKGGAKAKAEAELEATNEDLKMTNLDLASLKKMNFELHADCDYLLKNFEVRQEARAAEIEAIGQAKNILAGAK